MIPSFIDKSKIPHKPGVYIYKDKFGRVIYVGKAIDLKNRVTTYFNGKHLEDGDVKTAVLVTEIASLDTIFVESELEALILEANLIKKYLPKFNIRLTDDKDYLYIKITKEAYPRILTARKHDLSGSLKYFGPFPSSTTVKKTLKQLRRVFPWCSYAGNRQKASGNRSCFYRHIGLCPGACSGEISQKDYHKIINNFIKFMEGGQAKLTADLNKQMQDAAKNEDFEVAEMYKKRLLGIGYLLQSNKVSSYLENPNFLEDQRIKALEELKKVLNLKKVPERIEGYDISNIQGHDAVASMVVLTNGEIDKSQYRKFKMQITGKPNDFAMHAETIRRRMKHSEWQTPDVLLIDGGKGQVSSVYEQIQKTGTTKFKKIPIFGIAKRMEWLYSQNGQEIRLPKSNSGLKLLQKLRDESHRFAITFHRKLRNKSFMFGDQAL